MKNEYSIQMGRDDYYFNGIKTGMGFIINRIWHWTDCVSTVAYVYPFVSRNKILY